MKRIIEKLIEKVQKDKDTLAISLFGSTARKEKNRDIDLCIFLKPKKYSIKTLSSKKMKFLCENERYDVQIFQALPTYIQERIIKEGKIIFCKNESKLYDIYFIALREIEDFKQTYQGYLEAVAHG